MLQRYRPSVDIFTLCALLSVAEEFSCSSINTAACFRGVVNSAVLIVKWRAHHFRTLTGSPLNKLG